MPLWNLERTLPRGDIASCWNNGDGTFTTSGAVFCSMSATMDPARRYKISSNIAYCTDAFGTSGTPPCDVLFLFLNYGTSAITTASTELTSDTVMDDAPAGEPDDYPYRGMSLQFLLPAGLSGLYYFGGQLKIVTLATGSVNDTFYGASAFQFLMVLEDIGAA